MPCFKDTLSLYMYYVCPTMGGMQGFVKLSILHQLLSCWGQTHEFPQPPNVVVTTLK